MKLRWVTLFLLLAAVASVVASRPAYFEGHSKTFAVLEPSISTPEERGIAYFAFGDWGALTSDALQVSASPWKLSLAALALQQSAGDIDKLSEFDASKTFRQFGFNSPQQFGNWPNTLDQPKWETPLGQNVGLATGHLLPTAATIGNIGCAGCHSSVMYNADGSPDLNRVWLGMPNGSINLEAYISQLFTAMRDYGNTEQMMDAVNSLFPETSVRERMTLRYFILPELQKVIAEREEAYGQLLPFRTSLAGATNGLDSLKRRFGLIPAGTILSESIFNSVPDLGGRVWRTKLLNTGSYTIPGVEHTLTTKIEDINKNHQRKLAGIIAFFTVPSMGVSLEVAEAHIDEAANITAWMMNYKPQAFPGSINAALLPQGQKVYSNACSECHGTYNESLESPELIAFPNWEGDIGTDKRRAELLSQEFADAVNDDQFGQYIEARTVTGYTAPPLTGLWSSAPYFHNGSVPTLWHLMNPETRPMQFQVGGHHLDLEKVGLAVVDDGQGGWYPEKAPWSIPAAIDTRKFGLSNNGHENSFDGMSTATKQALLEYLKLL